MQVGDKVMLRDNWCTLDYQLPQAEIVEIKDDSIVLRKSYLIRFPNGTEEWWPSWALKTQ